MGLNGNNGKDIREAIERFVKNLVKANIEKAPFNKTKNGRVVTVSPQGYTVEIENKLYPNMLSVNGAILNEGDVVACVVPNNQMSQAYISGRLVQQNNVQGGGGGGGGGDVSDVRVNNVSVVSGGVANITLSSVAVSGSYNDLSDKPTIPTSINGLSGGSLTSPLVIYGGDGTTTTASKISLDQSRSGQITDNATSTLFGFLANNATTLTVGSNSYALNLRGNGTRPTYKGNDLALYSDLPKKTSDLTNDGNGTLYEGETDPFVTKSFVNSSIATNTANFIGTFQNVTALNAYSGTVTNNDYAFVVNSVVQYNGGDFPDVATLNTYDKTFLTNFDYAWVVNGTKFDLYRFDFVDQTWYLRATAIVKDTTLLNTAYNRYKATVSGNTVTWGYEYTLNNSSFTAAQWAAINSGITSTLVSQITTNETAISGLTSDISNIKNGQTINSFAGVESALDGKVSLSNNGSQTITTTGASGDNRETALFLQSNTTTSYVGFKNSSGTILGYYGVDANNKPIFYDTSAKQIALTDDINDATLTIQLNGSSVETFTANSSANKTANIKALPNYSLNISTSAGNPREVRFVRINYSTFDGNNAAYFKIGAMCSHGNGSSYTFLEDIIIGCNMNGSCTCEVYKQVQNVSTYTVGGTTVHFGDVYWTVDTTNKIVDFYIICGQYATINFTPFTAIGATVKDTSKIFQYTGSATLYSSGTRIWANGNSTLYARLNDIPESAITATPSRILQRDGSGNANAVAFNLCVNDTSSVNATMQYNRDTESIEFTFS